MTFQNIQIDPEELPRASELELRPMDPAYLREVKVQQALTWALALVISVVPWLVVVQPQSVKSALALGPLVILALTALIVPLVIARARVQAYALREHDVAFRSGLFWRKTVLLPFERIQHVELSSGPLQRRYGLASLKFYTAGGASVDLRMDGLKEEQAQRIRRFIMGEVDDRSDG